MRIRKNAKISTSFYTNTNLSNAADECLCQLNQSPWDIITFPSSDSSPSLHQVDDNEVYYKVNLAGNGSWVDSIGAVESVASVKTSELENYYLDDPKNDYGEILGFESEIEEEIVLCGKKDEQGWQCGREVKNGNTMCDHHTLALQNGAVWTTKKKSVPINGSKSGTRPHQSKKRASTSPYDFYYYSGFGPSWGKKRGSNTYKETTKVKEMSYDMDITIEMEKIFEPETSNVGPTKMEPTDIDDDDVYDNKKGKSGIMGKKRGRKPIKARSLKSLM